MRQDNIAPFLETIKLLDGQFYHLPFHQLRIKRTQKAFFPDLLHEHFSLPQALGSLLKKERIEIPSQGLYRCRLLYRRELESIEFIPYLRREIRSLKMIESDLDYAFKSSDRNALDRLFALREQCDDILIVKRGFITDTTIANIALFQPDTKMWHTPQTPLLKGTKREALLAKKKITPRKITPQDLDQYSKIALFNAMIDFGEMILSTKNIVK